MSGAVVEVGSSFASSALRHFRLFCWIVFCASLLGSGSRSKAQSIELTPKLKQAFEQRYGAKALTRLKGLDKLLRSKADLKESTKRTRANKLFNRIRWISDKKHWGKRDYWATPFEMLGTNGGDCEDFSITKYFALTAMQVPASKLLITYVRAPQLKQTHMVLAYYETPDSEPFILDNLDPKIRPASQRSDLIPIYSFNADGLWNAVQVGRGKRVGSSKRIKLWRSVLNRMNHEFE